MRAATQPTPTLTSKRPRGNLSERSVSTAYSSCLFTSTKNVAFAHAETPRPPQTTSPRSTSSKHATERDATVTAEHTACCSSIKSGQRGDRECMYDDIIIRVQNRDERGMWRGWRASSASCRRSARVGEVCKQQLLEKTDRHRGFKCVVAPLARPS